MDLPDVQNRRGDFGHPLQAGVTNLVHPIKLKVKDTKEVVSTNAQITLTVHLPKDRRGVNMSRLPRVLNKVNWDKQANRVIGEVLTDSLGVTKADSAEVSMAFPYFFKKQSPVSDNEGLLHADCMIAGSRQRQDIHAPYITELMVQTSVMTLCPCSKEISDHGAHNQRATVELSVYYRSDTLIWIEDLISVAEEAASSGVYPIVKREDEKYITEQAYDNPKFVEDVARSAANALDSMDRIIAYEIQVSSDESIHQHNAIARIQG